MKPVIWQDVWAAAKVLGADVKTREETVKDF